MKNNCGCFNSLAAASVVPVKRYNQLVPAIFPKGSAEPDAVQNPAVIKQMAKLLEYVQKNPERGPKVHHVPSLSRHRQCVTTRTTQQRQAPGRLC